MEPCNIPYIPEKLHSNDKAEVQVFFVGELLFRRCQEGEIENPFEKISLYDLSVNRSGREGEFSIEEDVLWNLMPEKVNGERIDASVARLVIKELTEDGQYYQTLSHQYQNQEQTVLLECVIELLHDKLPCNYAHCIFQFTFNGTKVERDNYKETLGRKGTAMSELRTRCKHEISKMILRREVRMSWE